MSHANTATSPRKVFVPFEVGRAASREGTLDDSRLPGSTVLFWSKQMQKFVKFNCAVLYLVLKHNNNIQDTSGAWA